VRGLTAINFLEISQNIYSVISYQKKFQKINKAQLVKNLSCKVRQVVVLLTKNIGAILHGRWLQYF
jgi:hypothetical protein